MVTIRRIYLYVVAAASLLLLTQGLVDLVRALLEATLGGQSTVVSHLRDTVARDGAFVTLGVPGWLVHWGIASRLARRDPAERAATLRRLYVYALLACFVLVAANAAQALLEALIRLVVDPSRAGGGLVLVRPLPRLVVSLTFWLYHRRVAAADRAAVGETGGAATLRRWYVYGVAFAGQMILLAHGRAVVETLWRTAAGAGERTILAGGSSVAAAGATALVGLLLWAGHWRPVPAPAAGLAVTAPLSSGPTVREVGRGGTDADDVRSLLRPVYLFLSLAVAVATTLYAGWQVVFYVLARLLGVDRPGGVSGGPLTALAGPGSLLAVYGVSWLYHRRAVQAQAAAQPELPRQCGVRRLYVYLVSLVALAVLASGAGGLLWTLADLLTNAAHTANPQTWWREQVSLYASLLVVGLPVWALHWGRVARVGPAAEASEAGSLARRLYVYLALLAAVLALLGAGVTVVYEIYRLLLGTAASPSVVTNLGRAVAVGVVAGLVAAYHLRVLRADLAASARAPAERPAAAEAAEAAEAPGLPDSLAAFDRGAAPAAERPYGVVFRRAGREASRWLPTAEAADAELARLRQTTPDLEWSVRVTAEPAPTVGTSDTVTAADGGHSAAAPETAEPADRAASGPTP